MNHKLSKKYNIRDGLQKSLPKRTVIRFRVKTENDFKLTECI